MDGRSQCQNHPNKFITAVDRPAAMTVLNHADYRFVSYIIACVKQIRSDRIIASIVILK